MKVLCFLKHLTFSRMNISLLNEVREVYVSRKYHVHGILISATFGFARLFGIHAATNDNFALIMKYQLN